MQILKNSSGQVYLSSNGKALGAPGKPIEVSTDAGMSAVLTADNIGKVYMFTGTTGTYTNGDLYIVVIGSGGYIFQHYEKEQQFSGLCLTANTAGSTVELTKVGSPAWNGQYSTNGKTWTTYAPSSTGAITLTNVGDKVYFKGDITDNFSNVNHLAFVMDGSISASGNVNSMYVSNGFDDFTDLTYSYCYCCMFSGCTSLTSAPELPATTLADGCYYYMFYNCTSLTTAPALPATILKNSCYASMFNGCSSLTTTSALSATTLVNNCYYEMFKNCTSLTTTPELPATTLANNCYEAMFCGCTSLITAPALPATTLAKNCYAYMFTDCALTTAPELSATTLAERCYAYMFQSCTSLTTAPKLPATTLAYCCYTCMFINCTSLTRARALSATTLADYCCHQMFYNCTSLTAAPSLSAKTLVCACYASMFENCTSLKKVPALPAKTLDSNCYNRMFANCTNLKVYSSSGTDHSNAWRIPTSGSASSHATQTGMFYGTTGDYATSTDVTLNKTFYTQNAPV